MSGLDTRRTPAQPRRVSNSFSREELEVLEGALQRVEDFRSLPGGLDAGDYDALARMMQTALRGGDISGLVRSKAAKNALTKLELLRGWTSAELSSVVGNGGELGAVTKKVAKMLIQSRLRDVIQAVPAEGVPCV